MGEDLVEGPAFAAGFGPCVEGVGQAAGTCGDSAMILPTGLLRQRLGFALVCGLAIAIVVLTSLLSPATDQVRTNLTPATVVARLQIADSPLPPALVAALKATRAAPDSIESARAAAKLLIDEGRRLGDS